MKKSISSKVNRGISSRMFALFICAAMLLSAGGAAVIAQEPAVARHFSLSNAVDHDITFSASDFNEYFTSNEGSVSTVRILTLPTAEGSAFMLGEEYVTDGMEISADLLDTLVFRPGTGWHGITSFEYEAKADEGDYSNSATVTLVIRRPAGPLVATNGSFEVVYDTMYTDGQLIGSDGGEDITFEFQVLKYPDKGVLDINVYTGEFTYDPFSGQTGADSFTFRITSADYDSDAAFMAIDILPSAVETEPPVETEQPDYSPPPSIFQYADLVGHWASYSAGMLVEEGITVGDRVGDKYFYRPDKLLTRAEMILLVTAAIGMDNLPPVDENFKFEDDAMIPSWLRQAAYRAEAADIIKGVEENGKRYLRPYEYLTRMEIFTILNNVINPVTSSEVVLDYADAGSIPDWGEQIVKNLKGYGLVTGFEDNTLRPDSLVTKAQGGMLTYKLVEHLDEYPSTAARLAAGNMDGALEPVTYSGLSFW